MKAAIAALLLAACSASAPRAGSPCVPEAGTCPTGSACIIGRCTRSCGWGNHGDDAGVRDIGGCEALPGTVCTGDSDAGMGGLCLPSCMYSSECPEGVRCRAGLCL